jgi:hypothetical protein
LLNFICPVLISFAGLARFLESLCSFLPYDLSDFAVSLRIFCGTVTILFYMLWRFSRRRIKSMHPLLLQSAELMQGFSPT